PARAPAATAARPAATPTPPCAAPTSPRAATPTAAPRPAAAPARAQQPAARPRATASAPKPAASAPKPATAATPAKPGKPAARGRAQTESGVRRAPERDTIRTAAVPPSDPPSKRGSDGKRVMAVRTRPTPNAGVPTPVAASATLPLVIPAPGREEFDDQRTVLFRGDLMGDS
ncbi:MAG: hypothetical protein K1X88_34805, partial [Nannocystaceae bacterium]|nr:hypothetical protein [Nannocystaceae bacterium]